ncbi:MAG: restriction endonuclease family protein [Chthonomonadaceae bacterium]|nr:restriction endonuclease family protein [Chthonomonadaceae bacterium]
MKTHSPKHQNGPKDQENPGISFEKAVARIQQMLDTDSVVSHNEQIIDRVGNKRQFDVVIRGRFGGRSVLGVIECKDHSRKKGPDAVEAFAKKTENVGANLRIMVSRKGFTDQALKLAKHENIGCLSLLPDDPKQAGFRIGQYWYGVIRSWKIEQMRLDFVVPPPPSLAAFDFNSVKYREKPAVNWFLKELYTTYVAETMEGGHIINRVFDPPRSFEVGGSTHTLAGIGCFAIRTFKKKRMWIDWSGDALYDWHTGQFDLPANGSLLSSAFNTDLSTWPDYSGEIPDPEPITDRLFTVVVSRLEDEWDDNFDNDVPDLGIL